MTRAKSVRASQQRNTRHTSRPDRQRTDAPPKPTAVPLTVAARGPRIISVARLSPDGQLVAAGDTWGFVLVYETSQLSAAAIQPTEPSASQRNLCHFAGINDVSWSPDGQYVASGGDDGLIVVWKLENGSLTSRRKLFGHLGPITCVRWGPRGSTLVSSSLDTSVRMWDVTSGWSMRALWAHSEPALSVDYAVDGSLFVSAAADGCFRVWDARGGQCMRSIFGAARRPLNEAIFSPNGEYVAAKATSGMIQIFDYVSEEPVKRYLPPNGIENDSNSRGLVFWRSYLVAGSPEGLRIWEVQSMKLIGSIPCAKGVWSVDIGHDVAVVSTSDGLLLLDMPTILQDAISRGSAQTASPATATATFLSATTVTAI